jgi:hypothetical protein
MLATRPPLATARFPRRPWRPARRLCRLWRVPQAAAGVPLHRDVGVFPLQLVERGQQLVAFAGAKRGRSVVDEDGPVGVARGH